MNDTQTLALGNYEVKGSENGQTWLVQIWQIIGIGEIAFCNCPAYRYSGDFGKQRCKHIKAVHEYVAGDESVGVTFLSGPQ